MHRKSLTSTTSRSAKACTDETLNITPLPPAMTIVRLPKTSEKLREASFANYYGHGCDAVVYAAQCKLERMAKACTESGGKTLSANTVASYYRAGLKTFLPFSAMMASALGRDLRLDDIDRGFIDHFIAHLKQGSGAFSTKKNQYSTTKSVLVAMGQSGWMSKDIFPRNPFPNYNRSVKGETVLCEPERRRVMRALKTDMRAAVKGDSPLTYEELSVCLLAIAVRTGINPTPALDLFTDCLQPHPIKADRYVLISFKRRGNATHIQSLRRAVDIKFMLSALPDVARIIDLVLRRNAEPRKASDDPKRLFVYKSQRNGQGNCRLTAGSLQNGVQKFTARHKLRDSDGKPLRLNMMRLRKTFENRLFTLSGQDPFLTARLGGHTPKVSNDHYLEAPDSAERDWRFMGEIRVEELLNQDNVVPLKTQNTPVASCRDTVNGELAPKSGEHCQKFLACFRCRSFVVTGDDLYRVFSLYWMLIRMRRKMAACAWKRLYGHIIRIIDREIVPEFDAELVAIQRQRAKVNPHPFWRDPDLLEVAL